MKLDADEKELLDSVERGEWKSAKGQATERLAAAVVAALGLTPERIDDIRGVPFEAIAQAVLKAQQASKIGLGPTIDGRVLRSHDGV